MLAGLCDPSAINVWYYASYDWNMLGQALPKWQQHELYVGRCLKHKQLAKECFDMGYHPQNDCGAKDDPNDIYEKVGIEKSTEIEGFTVKLVPKKILAVTSPEGEKGVHYDAYSFFARSFQKTLEMCKLEVPPIIVEGKAGRGDFESWDPRKVEKYNFTECVLLVRVMDMLRAALDTIGYGDLKGWHGPGAIASAMMDKMEVTQKMKPGSDQEWLTGFKNSPVLAAYYGGRSELLKRGEYSPVYNYDINSAYPSATRELPTLAGAKWHKVFGEQALGYDFGVCKVSWSCADPMFPMGPFPFRVGHNSFLPEDNIIFPSRMTGKTLYPKKGVGWYHLAEVKAAINRGFWEIEPMSAWVIDNGYETPFREPINEMMSMRLKYKAEGNFAHLPIKLGANSFYGKFAQRMEDKRAFGSYNNMMYCGFQTAWTRARILDKVDPWAVIMISTDGQYSTKPVDCATGDQLGEWEFDLYESGQFILPGIYALTRKGKREVKARGYPVKQLEANWDFVYSQAMLGKKPVLDDVAFMPVRKCLRSYKKYPLCGFYPAPKRIDRDIVDMKRQFVSNDISLPYLPAPDRPEESQSKLFEPFKRAPSKHREEEEDEVSVDGD